MKAAYQKQLIKYIIGDYVAANLAWVSLNAFRYNFMATCNSFQDFYSYISCPQIILGQIICPLLWLVIYYFSGYYNSPMRKSRLQEFNKTLYSIQIGVIFFFFIVVFKDLPGDYRIYYKLIGILFSSQFLFTYGIRVLLTQSVTKKIHNREFGFNTLIIGAGERAKKLASELDSQKQSLGYSIVGFMELDKNAIVAQNKPIWEWDKIDQIIHEKEIEEIIVVPESTNKKELLEPLSQLYHFNLPIKAIADENNILSRSVKMTAIYDLPMIEITRDNMSDGEKNFKEVADKVIAFIALCTFSPLFVWLAWKIKKSSPGDIFYKQERVGYRGKPFSIIKFRTMKMDAEQGTPQLSSEDDDRMTPFGRTMRKYRLDELPQFWNVLKGEMSLVGPRPERDYFVQLITQKAPSYYLLFSVKPGITSWGMVKYGYANTVDKMIERLQFDLIYLDNRSLSIDIKILIYTIRTILTGKGM